MKTAPTLEGAPADKTKGLNYLNDWVVNLVGYIVKPYHSILAHKAQIMDAVELKSPNAIVTCSLDRCIRMWDLATGNKMGSFKPKHAKGVRCLDYTPEYSGYIISVGHENIIKVWSPEVQIDMAYVGNLEGHNTAVTCAKFIENTQFVISIDDRLTIRVWDIRSMTCLQVLTQDKKKFECNGLCIIPKSRKFLMYGRRMVLFDTAGDKLEANENNKTEDAFPFQVEFNTYYKTFVAATK